MKKEIQALQKKGHSESSALTVCSCKSKDTAIQTFDYNTNDLDFTSKIDDETGFLKVSATLARTGVQQYLGMELPKEFGLDAFKIYNVFRPKEEVLKKESLDSYTNATITDNHPSEFVTVDNIGQLGKGSIASVKTFNSGGIDFIQTDMIITDKETIKKAKDGKVELSPGYSTRYEKKSGNFQGLDYDFIQTDIMINHIALVDKGRCQGACKINDSIKNVIINSKTNKERFTMSKIRIGDTEFEVCDTIAGAYANLQSKNETLDKEFKEFIKEKKEEKEENDKKDGAKDAEMEKLKKDNKDLEEKEKEKTGDADIHARVIDRAALFLQVASYIGDADISKMNDADIRKLAVGKVSDADLSEKSEVYIGAMYDTLIVNAKKTNDSLIALGNSLSTDTKVTDARAAYMTKIAEGK